MAGVRFPYKRRDPLSDIVGFNGGNLRDQLDGDRTNQSPDRMAGVQSSYPTIDPAYIPPATPSNISTEPAPVIDPAILAKTSFNPRIPVSTEPAPIMVRHPGERPGKPTRPTREGMIGEGTAEDANRAYGESVDRHQPKAEPKWKRYLRIAAGVGSIFAGAAAHDPEAVSRAAMATGANLADDKFIDKGWKAREQADVAQQENRYLGRRRAEATIKEIEARPEEKAARERRLQQGVDLRGQSVSNARLAKALEFYHKHDYTPGENPSVDEYLDNSGLHNLAARKATDKWEYKLVDGALLRLPKSGDAEISPATMGGKSIVAPGEVHDQSVKLPDGTELPYLTAKEKLAYESGTYQKAEDRKSREKIASNAQAGANTRASMRGGNGSAINPSVKGAVAALSKFRGMTANIEKQKTYYGTSEGPAPDSHPAIRALYEQRDGYEADMKRLYGQYIELDSAGKPKGLRDDAMNPSTPQIDLTGQQRSLAGWRKTYPKATKEQEAAWKAKVEAAGGTVIK